MDVVYAGNVGNNFQYTSHYLLYFRLCLFLIAWVERLMLYRLIITLALLGLALDGQADFQAGGDAYKRGDYETAAKEFLPLAKNGDHRAMYALGSMYSVGRGVKQDFKEAFKWFQRAARYGRPDAEYKLGIMYAQGFGVEQDYQRALNWYGKSAKKGYALAQNKIGQMYLEGKGVTQSYIKAYAWSSIAADQSVEDARQVLTVASNNMSAEELKEAEDMAREFKAEYVKNQ